MSFFRNLYTQSIYSLDTNGLTINSGSGDLNLDARGNIVLKQVLRYDPQLDLSQNILNDKFALVNRDYVDTRGIGDGFINVVNNKKSTDADGYTINIGKFNAINNYPITINTDGLISSEESRYTVLNIGSVDTVGDGSDINTNRYNYGILKFRSDGLGIDTNKFGFNIQGSNKEYLLSMDANNIYADVNLDVRGTLVTSNLIVNGEFSSNGSISGNSINCNSLLVYETANFNNGVEIGYQGFDLDPKMLKLYMPGLGGDDRYISSELGISSINCATIRYYPYKTGKGRYISFGYNDYEDIIGYNDIDIYLNLDVKVLKSVSVDAGLNVKQGMSIVGGAYIDNLNCDSFSSNSLNIPGTISSGSLNVTNTATVGSLTVNNSFSSNSLNIPGTISSGTLNVSANSTLETLLVKQKAEFSDFIYLGRNTSRAANGLYISGPVGESADSSGLLRLQISGTNSELILFCFDNGNNGSSDKIRYSGPTHYFSTNIIGNLSNLGTDRMIIYNNGEVNIKQNLIVDNVITSKNSANLLETDVINLYAENLSATNNAQINFGKSITQRAEWRYLPGSTAADYYVSFSHEGNTSSIIGYSNTKIDLNKNTILSGTLSVTGSSTLAGLTCNTLSINSTTGTTTISNNLSVTGSSSTLAGLTCNTLSVTNTTGDTTISNNLSVTGSSTLKGNVICNNALSVTGNSTFKSGVYTGLLNDMPNNTCFPYTDNKNYIKGDTIINGSLNINGKISMNYSGLLYSNSLLVQSDISAYNIVVSEFVKNKYNVITSYNTNSEIQPGLNIIDQTGTLYFYSHYNVNRQNGGYDLDGTIFIIRNIVNTPITFSFSITNGQTIIYYRKNNTSISSNTQIDVTIPANGCITFIKNNFSYIEI